MEENPELEEGEAFPEGYNNNMDPDISLSYIDEKIQNVLGHFQKDFEGGVSAENLGAKFDEYGSFLPTYERSPQKSSVPSHPKTPQKNSSTERTPNNMSMEGVSQSVKVPVNDASSVKLGIPSGNSNALQKSGLASGSVPVKKESKFPKNPLKSGSSSDQRTLKVRIKVGPDSLARKNAAIYSGLGLDISPSSSLGNSPEVCGGMTVQQNADKSPSSILQVMTSFPVQGGAMVSPLHENLLCLIKKETFFRDVKPVPFLKGGQTNSSLLGKDSVSLVGNEKVSKRKGLKYPMKSEKAVEVKQENDAVFGNNTTFSTEMKVENETLESKKVVKKVHLPGTIIFNGTLKVTGRPSEVSLDTDEDGVGGNIFSSDLMREDSLESRSGHDSGKSEKRNAQTKSGLAENILEHRAVPSNDDGSVHWKGSKKSKKIKARAPSKIYPEASSRSTDNLPHGNLAPTEEKVFQQDAVSVQAEFKMSPLKDKPLPASENSHASKINKKAVAHGRLEIGVNRESDDLTIATHGVSKFKDKMQKLKFQDTSKLRDNTKLELKKSQNRLSEKPSGDRQRCSIIDRHDTSFDKSNEGLSVEGYSGKEVINHLMRSSVKDAVNVGISVAESTFAPEAALPLQHEVKDSWVGCDRCEKWRLLPYGILPENLPDKWTCKMLNWLPGMNRCDISEDVTTQAIRDMYLVPLSVGQNHVQNDINRSTSEVQGQHEEHSHQSLDFPPGPTPGKKKHALKELAKAGVGNGMMRSSNSSNNQLRESLKSRSVNNMDQPPLEASLTNKSSESRNMVAEVKQNPVIGGNIKQVKIKNKREVDNDGYGNPKKAKIDVPDADKNCSWDTGSGKLGINSKTGLSIKIRGHDSLKPSEGSFSGDVKSNKKERFPVSLKKPCDQSQMLSDGGSLNVRTSDKMNISLKKRKLKEWQDDQNGLNRTGNAEHSSESGLKKVKISNRGASVMCNSSEKLDKKEKMAHMLSSEGQDHAVDGEDAERRANKDQRPRKHRRSLTSQQHFDGAETSRKDLVIGQHSVTATSSSSKVSGSLKTRTPLDDVRGSPVESVSSSPLRIPFSEKLGPTRGDTLGKDDAKDCGLPVADATNKFRMGKKEKVSGGPRPDTSKTILSDRQDGDSIRKLHQTKSSSQLINGGCEIMEKHKLSVDLSAAGNCDDEVIADKNLIEKFPPSYKSSRGAPLQSKENGRSLVFKLDRDMKLSEPEKAQVDIFNKRKKESEAGGGSHESLHKRMNCGKISISDKPSSKFSKDEKVHISKGNSVSQFSKDGRMERTLKHDLNDPNKKLVSLDCSEQNVGSRGNLQRPDNQIKVDSVQKELKTETLTLVPHMEGKVIHKSNIQHSAQGYQQERASDGHCTHASANADVSKTSRCPESSGKVNGFQSMLAARNVKDLTAPASASKETASDALAEAKHWKDDADRVKGLGFGFESNEMNFQAALKFLHGASLLETSNEVGRQGEMTQMQAYNTSAKLCESCAVEYERRSEMAAAALAYKCMEVAHWRIVYCKSSSLSRDRNELQACLQAFPQGDSPSSSASDIDNLNNPATVDKAAVSKSAISHAAGNPVIVARNHSNFLWLLDFTQDVNSAVKATKKSQIAYSAANLAMEEAHNKDCIISVKKVIDFCYQDVEGFLDLVKQAMDAINRSGSVGKRD